MCVLRLRVHVPDQRPCRPLCADERILAANEIDVAGPEQLVVIVLGDEGHGGEREPATAEAPARMEFGTAGPAREHCAPCDQPRRGALLT